MTASIARSRSRYETHHIIPLTTIHRYAKYYGMCGITDKPVSLLSPELQERFDEFLYQRRAEESLIQHIMRLQREYNWLSSKRVLSLTRPPILHNIIWEWSR